MKKLLLRILLFFIIILIPLQVYLFCFPMQYNHTDYVMWKDTWDNLKDSESEVIIIGDSRAKAGIYPLNLNDDVYSLTLGGATPIEGYYTLKEYLENNNNPEYVVLSYAPFNLQEHGWLWYRTIKYGFLDIESEIEILKKYNNSGVGSKKDYLKLALYKIKYPKLYLNEVTDSIKNFSTKRKKNFDVLERLQKTKGYHWFAKGDYSDEHNVETGYSSFSATTIIDEYMRMILEMCKEENIPVYYVTMPMNEASYSALSEDYKKGYDEYFGDLLIQYPNMRMLYGIGFEGNENFSDSSHMSENGAKFFTEKLDKSIDQLREQGRE